jgi:hypothetical protein
MNLFFFSFKRLEKQLKSDCQTNRKQANNSPSVGVWHKNSMVVVHNVAVAASRRVPERRQGLVGGWEGAHVDGVRQMQRPRCWFLGELD